MACIEFVRVVQKLKRQKKADKSMGVGKFSLIEILSHKEFQSNLESDPS